MYLLNVKISFLKNSNSLKIDSESFSLANDNKCRNSVSDMEIGEFSLSIRSPPVYSVCFL